MTWSELIEKTPAIGHLHEEATRVASEGYRGYEDEYAAYAAMKRKLSGLVANSAEYDVAITKIAEALRF